MQVLVSAVVLVLSSAAAVAVTGLPGVTGVLTADANTSTLVALPQLTSRGALQLLHTLTGHVRGALQLLHTLTGHIREYNGSA